jgi:hypothetical protein
MGGTVEKRSSAALRFKPHRSTYVYIRLAVRLFARLASEHIVKSFGFYRQGKCLFIIAPPCGNALPVNSPQNGIFQLPRAIGESFLLTKETFSYN